jgi:hypothetical protein
MVLSRTREDVAQLVQVTAEALLLLLLLLLLLKGNDCGYHHGHDCLAHLHSRVKLPPCCSTACSSSRSLAMRRHATPP